MATVNSDVDWIICVGWLLDIVLDMFYHPPWLWYVGHHDAAAEARAL
jgi:hypothetical protein